MSDNDPTKDIAQKYDTKPTLETLLGMMTEMRDEMRAGFVQMERRFDAVDVRFDAVDVRLDRMDAVAHDTQAKFHSLRADFNELKIALREHFPTAVK